MQAVAKHGGAAEREVLVEEALPRLLDLAKNPYGHFLVSKLLAVAPKPKLTGETTDRVIHPACASFGPPVETAWHLARTPPSGRHSQCIPHQ